MAHIRKMITLEQVKDANPSIIYYGVKTCWWTHRAQDLRVLPNGLPCDPRGGVLMQGDAKGFLANAERQAPHYGRHGIEAFMAAHNDNCVVSPTDTRPTCLQSWDAYNDLLDRLAEGGC